MYVVTLHGLNLVSSAVFLDHNESDKKKRAIILWSNSQSDPCTSGSTDICNIINIIYLVVT